MSDAMPEKTSAAAANAIELPPLPYSTAALDPHISAETLELHHGRHHKAYVEKTNALLAQSPLAGRPLADVVLGAEPGTPLFNNAAQAWNHDFYFRSMKPGGGGSPRGEMARLVDRAFGGYDGFRERFAKEAVGHFASGWAWLVLEGKDLRIVSTHDADLPMRHGQRALLACDLWEHAYYVDYGNERPKYVAAFLEHLLDWDWAERQMQQG
jgi:Fe-Mn family superoxide dismutase